MPQSSARSFMVILLSGLVRSTFFSDASSARLVICDMSAPCCAAFSRIFCCCGVFAWLTAVQGKAMQRRARILPCRWCNFAVAVHKHSLNVKCSYCGFADVFDKYRGINRCFRFVLFLRFKLTMRSIAVFDVSMSSLFCLSCTQKTICVPTTTNTNIVTAAASIVKNAPMFCLKK